MKNTILILSCVCLSMASNAGVYKCTDSSGETSYQSKPCTLDHQAFEIDVKSGIKIDLSQQQALELKQRQDLEHQQEQQRLSNQQAAKRVEQALAETKITQELIKNNPKQFSAFAIPPYDPEHLPALVEPFAERLPEIERLRRSAAQKALASGQCQRVEADELNQKSTHDRLVFLIDCSSGKSFYFSETELISL